jgi:ribosomal protein S18 acetylase RimI-like enzyme
MIVQKMNILDAGTQNQIEEMVGICNQHDGTRGKIKLDNSVQYYPEMNNLFVAYEDEKMVCVIKLFSVFKKSVELSGYTHPDYRDGGVFKRLLTDATEEVRCFHFDEILYVIDSDSIIGLDWAEKKSLIYQSTEVTMRLVNYSSLDKCVHKVFLKKAEDMDVSVLIALHQELFNLSYDAAEKYLNKVMRYEDKDFYLMLDSERIIGLGGIYRQNSKAIIFGIGVRKAFRGKGYSKVLIGKLVNLARKQEYFDIELEVDQDNHRAYNLYKGVGFVDYYSMSYYRENL